MKVTEDPFTAGLMTDSVFGSTFAYDAAQKILSGVGTKCERQGYSRDEIEWACKILGRPFDHVIGKAKR